MGFIPTSFGVFYCVVTNDIQRREGEHNVKFLGYVTAKTVKGALELEAMMHNVGFNTGKKLRNASDDSVYVYVYKIGPNTVERRAILIAIQRTASKKRRILKDR